jgi:hypothetical protein
MLIQQDDFQGLDYCWRSRRSTASVGDWGSLPVEQTTRSNEAHAEVVRFVCGNHCGHNGRSLHCQLEQGDLELMAAVHPIPVIRNPGRRARKRSSPQLAGGNPGTVLAIENAVDADHSPSSAVNRRTRGFTAEMLVYSA